MITEIHDVMSLDRPPENEKDLSKIDLSEICKPISIYELSH